MFLSRLKIKPTTPPPAGKTAAQEGSRTGGNPAIRQDGNSRLPHANNTRGAIGTLAAIALLMWFISFFLLAGPGIGVSDSSGVSPSVPAAAKVVANHP